MSFVINKPAVAKYKYTLDGAGGINSFQVATGGGHELIAILVTGGTADIVASIHDSANGAGEKNQTIWIGANQGESMTFCPAQSISMKNGIYLLIEQGGSPFNGKVTIVYN